MARYRNPGMGSIEYTLDGGTVVQLPDEWPGMTPSEHVSWIEQSGLTGDVASKLEEELGLDVWGQGTDVVTSSASGPRARTPDELSKLLKAANGKLKVSSDSSVLIVAYNNNFRFGIAKQSDGSYEITEHAWGSLLSGNTPIYLGIGLLALVAVGGGAAGRR